MFSVSFSSIQWERIAIIYFVAAIIIAQVVSPDFYSIKRNTISDLGSQGYDRNWIQQVGFIGFGVLYLIACAWQIRMQSIYKLSYVLLSLYATSVFFTGIYSTKPMVNHIQYDQLSSSLHSFFAQAAGFVFTIAMVLAISKAVDVKTRMIHGVFLLLIVACSACFKLVPAFAGLFQRALYLFSFIWMWILPLLERSRLITR